MIARCRAADQPRPGGATHRYQSPTEPSSWNTRRWQLGDVRVARRRRLVTSTPIPARVAATRGRRRSRAARRRPRPPGNIGAHHLLDQEVRCRERRVDVDGRRDRAEGVVRRHRHKRRLGHRGNALQLGDTTAVADVGLSDRAGTLREQLLELPASHEPLSRGNRDRESAGDLDQCVDVAGLDRLLQNHGAYGARACP